MSTNNTTEAPNRVPDFTDLFGTTDENLRRIIAEDLAGIPRDELVEGFREAYAVLDGFKLVAEVLSIPTYTVLNDAQEARAGEALERLDA